MNTIRFWQDRLAEIYPNARRTPDYMMAHIYTAASDLGRHLLRGVITDDQDKAVFRAVSWMMALATHFDVDYEAALVARFPGHCFYCLKRPCECDVTGRFARDRQGRMLSTTEIENERRAFVGSIRNTNTLVTFDWLIAQIAAIYPSNRALLRRGGQSYITGKMLEEGGELHRAYSAKLQRQTKTTDGIASELADLTAWIISCWNLSGDGKSFGAAWAERYAAGCHICRKSPCKCRDYSISNTQEEKLREAVELLRELQAEGVAAKEIAAALKEAERLTQSPTQENRKSFVERAKKALDAVKIYNVGADAGEHIVEHAEAVLDALGV